ncbi:MAG: MGMT family protein [Ferruginibacter sp.]
MKKGKTSKSWLEKMQQPAAPRVVEVPARWAGKMGDGRMLIPTPLLVAAAIRKIHKGKLATVNSLRDYLAGQQGADMTCPLTTGIFMNIAAHAAEEERELGRRRITPWWRVLKEGGVLNPKFPGGIAKQRSLLQAEGFRILKGRAREQWLVEEYQQKMEAFD